MGSLFGAIGGGILSTAGGLFNLLGQDESIDGVKKGASAEERQQILNREQIKRTSDDQINRFRPYVQLGNEAIPEFVSTMGNQNYRTGLPSETIKQQMNRDFLGENAPDYVTEKAFKDIQAIEQQNNLDRLSDLMRVGSVGAGGTINSRANMATAFGNSLLNTGRTQAQALQDAATLRQNQGATLFQGLSDLIPMGFDLYNNYGSPNKFNPYSSLQGFRGSVNGGGFI